MEACKAKGPSVLWRYRSRRRSIRPLIRPAADKLAARLAELNFVAPQIPVINNVDVAIETDVARIRTPWFARPTTRCAGSRRCRRWPAWGNDGR